MRTRAQAHHGELGGEEMGPKILRWSRPWSTCISLHTLSSFPFFGMALSVTSRVTSSGAVGAEGFGVAAKEVDGPAVRRPARV